MNFGIMVGLILISIGVGLDWTVPVISIFTSNVTLAKWFVIFSWIFLAVGVGILIGFERHTQWFIQNHKFLVLGLALLAAIHTFSRIPLVSGSTKIAYLICAILYIIVGILFFVALQSKN